jgi:DNA-binding IclR family transcriptional regulator
MMNKFGRLDGLQNRATAVPKDRTNMREHVEASVRTINPNFRSVPAVTRAIAALRLFGATDGPLTLNLVAKHLNVVPSTALHILRVLVQEELVAFDPDTKSYELDAGILTLARKMLLRDNFADRVQRPIEHLVKKYKVTMLASRVMGIDHSIVVASCSSTLPMRLHVEVGNRFPALMSATGRCVAAFSEYQPEQLRKAFDRIRWDKPPTYDEWLQEVKDAARRRYSIDRGNYLAGVTVIAVPVLNPERKIRYAIVALGLNDQMTPSAIKDISRDLRSLADEFSK